MAKAEIAILAPQPRLSKDLKPFCFPNQAFQKSRFLHTIDSGNNLAFFRPSENKDRFGLSLPRDPSC